MTRKVPIRSLLACRDAAIRSEERLAAAQIALEAAQHELEQAEQWEADDRRTLAAAELSWERERQEMFEEASGD